MSDSSTQQAVRHKLAQQLATARRELREQEQRLAQLKYEWGITKRMRSQARSEDEREKWHVQSEAFMGMVLQQESVVEELKGSVERHQKELAVLDDRLSGGSER